MPEFNSDSDPLVALFSVTKSYGEFLENESSHKVSRERGLYEATRGKWQIKPERRKKIKYAAAVAKGKILQVYLVNEWRTAGTGEKYETRPDLNKETPRFWEFSGEPANDGVGEKLIHLKHRMYFRMECKRLSKLLNPSDTQQRESDMTKTAIELLEQFYQIIFHGPPGTGKTRAAKQVLKSIFELGEDDDDRLQSRQGKQWDIVQFHPSYNYEDFVRGVQVETKGNEVAYETMNRVFGDMCRKANAAPEGEKYALIIDEINRANVSAVLGELIYALEYRGESVKTPYKIKNPDDPENEGDSTLVIPKNLYVIGTMNTADRTIGQIDYAVRRRFAFVDCPPKEQIIREQKDLGEADDNSLKFFRRVDALFIKDDKTPSDFISSDFDTADVRVGHSYFLAAGSKLGYKLVYQVVPILREYVKDGVLKKEAESKIQEIEDDARELLEGKSLAGELAESDSLATNQKEEGKLFFNWRNGDRFGVAGVGHTAFGVIKDFIAQNPNMNLASLQEEFKSIAEGKHTRVTLWESVNWNMKPLRYFQIRIPLKNSGESIAISAQWGATGHSERPWKAFKEKMASLEYSIGRCYLVNLGEGHKGNAPSRNWELCREHAFVSARGVKYIKAINSLEEGDFLFVKLVDTADNNKGVVACAEVSARAVLIDDFQTTAGPLKKIIVDGVQTYEEKYPSAFESGDLRERVVGVKWIGEPKKREDAVHVSSPFQGFYTEKILEKDFNELRKEFGLPVHKE